MLISQIRSMSKIGALKWTTHMSVRLHERGISASDVKNCIQVGEIIERYPDDCPYPSYLICGMCCESRPLHVVIGVSEEYLWFITAYFPSTIKWSPDYKTRKVTPK